VGRAPRVGVGAARSGLPGDRVGLRWRVTLRSCALHRLPRGVT
jgi:hypothetical protein